MFYHEKTLSVTLKALELTILKAHEIYRTPDRMSSFFLPDSDDYHSYNHDSVDFLS